MEEPDGAEAMGSDEEEADADVGKQSGEPQVQADGSEGESLAEASAAFPDEELLNTNAETYTSVVFERYGAEGKFKMVRSTTQVIPLSEDCVLPSLEGNAAVEMSFEVMSNGRWPRSGGDSMTLSLNEGPGNMFTVHHDASRPADVSSRVGSAMPVVG